MTETTENQNGSSLPVDRLKDAARTLLKAASQKAVGAAIDQVDGLTNRLTDVAENGGKGIGSVFGGGGGDDDDEEGGGGGGIGGALKSGASKVKDAIGNVIPGMSGSDDDDEDADGDGDGSSGGGGAGGARGKFKFMNIYETQDVGVPIRVAYDQWTQFADFPSFMKRLESVNQESDEKSTWTAKVFWSRRSWSTTIREQVPDSHILWVASGAKGYADGFVSFHELASNMTRIILILEYYPQGFFEKTGNLWRAVGRRARLEFKHFCRHVMMDTLINRDELEGWRGEIRDSEVVKTHEEAMEEEQAALESSEESEEDELAPEDEVEDDELAEDEYDEDGEPLDADEEYEDEPVDEDGEPLEAEDEYEDEPADEVDEPEDEAEPEDEPVDEDVPEEEPEPRPRRGRRRSKAAV
ncbi:SRPBCC family protein [Actinomycetospora atypica]|uniref:SRPBCC family protein n=1 Tax=Actinomycetospora atypica TaxID=1290095 RepID=A0ABV9YKL9_9PSEU